MKNKFPIFIINRDRVSCLIQLIDWLEKAGHENIFIIDNDSTYEPLIEFYKNTNHTVLYQNKNTGHNGIWYNGIIEKYAKDKFFIVSDPDVVPIKECPLDAVDLFHSLLIKYPDRIKAGFSLKINDIPDHFKFKSEVIKHESGYMDGPSPEDGIVFAPIDTTFALYRPGAGAGLHSCIRTKYPYEARHIPWYINSSSLDEEELYYRSRMSKEINSWNQDSKPRWLN
jgi:hypothetical protein